MCQTVSIEYEADARAPRRAREFAAQWLRDVLPASAVAGELIGDVGVVVSELVTNVVNAGGSRAGLGLAVHRDYIRITVDDDAPNRPRPRQAGPADEHGRGLALVAVLGRGWGVETLFAGKRIWVELAAASELTVSISCRLRNQLV